jgi:hypothetical protein
VGTAQINFETAQSTSHAQVVEDWADGEATPLADYTNDVFQADHIRRQSLVTVRVTRLTTLAEANETLAYGLNLVARDLAVAKVTADKTLVSSLLMARTVHVNPVSIAARTYTVSAAQARADRAVAMAEAERDIGNGVADAQRDFANDLAVIGVAWVSDVADLKHVQHVARYTSAAENAYEAALETADAQRADDEDEANITRVGKIGDALVEFAEDEGDADIELADDLGTARHGFLTTTSAAAGTFANSRKTALITFTQTDAGAAAQHDANVAGAHKTWTGSAATAENIYATSAGLADVTRAQSVAQAEAGYHVELAETETDDAETKFLADPTDENEFLAAYAAARSQFLTDTSASYVTAAMGHATAEAGYTNALIAAQGVRSNGLAEAQQFPLC